MKAQKPVATKPVAKKSAVAVAARGDKGLSKPKGRTIENIGEQNLIQKGTVHMFVFPPSLHPVQGPKSNRQEDNLPS